MSATGLLAILGVATFLCGVIEFAMQNYSLAIPILFAGIMILGIVFAIFTGGRRSNE